MEIKDLLVRYGVIAGRRFYNREKLRFLKGSAKQFLESGYEINFKETKRNQRKITNLYVGDLKSSKVTVSAYYDTPAKTFNLIKHEAFSPINDNKSFLIAIMVPILFIILIGTIYLNYIVRNNLDFKSIFVLIPILVLLLCLLVFRNGIGNKQNIIRNTAAVISCFKLSEESSKNIKSKISFAFTDFGCVNRIGDSFLAEELDSNKLVIFLDCIGGSKKLRLLYSEDAFDIANKLKNTLSEKIEFSKITKGDKKYYSILNINKFLVLTSEKIQKENLKSDLEYVEISIEETVNTIKKILEIVK